MTLGGRPRSATSLGHLAREAATRGGQRPFVTFYDDATGERTELGHATVANWVSKTANLLAGEFGLGPQRTLEVRLPTHWTTLVVLLAAWRCGVLVVRGHDTPGADVIVLAEGLEEIADPRRTIVVGSGLAGRVLGDARGALPFGQEVLVCDDEFDDPALDHGVPALAEDHTPGASGERTLLTHGDLLDLATATARALALEPGWRVLLAHPLETLEGLAVVLAALQTDASLVLVVGQATGGHAERAAAERCDLVLGPATGPGSTGEQDVRTLVVERGAGGAVTGVHVA